MAAATRKVCFGSKYSFQDSAVDLLREKFQRRLKVPAPFIAYDKSTHLLSIECNRNDEATPLTLFTCMRECIAEQQKLSAIDVPSINPQPGMVIENEYHLVVSQPEAPIRDESEILLDIQDATDPADDTLGASYAHVYWPSVEGDKNISTVPRAILALISAHTGTHITQEADHWRWRIDGAGAQVAFGRLERLKPAVSYLVHPPKANVLIKGHFPGEVRIELPELLSSVSARQRVILSSSFALADTLLAVLTRVCIHNILTGEKTTPKNLLWNVSHSDKISPTDLWKDYVHLLVGVPYPSSHDVSGSSQTAGVNGRASYCAQVRDTYSRTEPVDMTDPSEELVVQDANGIRRVLDWNRDVRGSEDPNQMKNELPADKAERGRTVRSVKSPTWQDDASTVVPPDADPVPSFDDLLSGSGQKRYSITDTKTEKGFGELMQENTKLPADTKPAFTFDELMAGVADPPTKPRPAFTSDELIREDNKLPSALQQHHPRPDHPILRTRESEHVDPENDVSLEHETPASPKRPTFDANKYRRKQGNDKSEGAQPQSNTKLTSYAQAASRGAPNSQAVAARGRSANIRKPQDGQPSQLIDVPRERPRPTCWDSSKPVLNVLSRDSSPVAMDNAPRGFDTSSPSPNESFVTAQNGSVDTVSDVGTSISRRPEQSPSLFVNTGNPRINMAMLNPNLIEKARKAALNQKNEKEKVQQVTDATSRKVPQKGKKQKKTVEDEKRRKLDEAWGPMPERPKTTEGHAKPLTKKPASVSSGQQKKTTETPQTREERLLDKEFSQQASTICNLLRPCFKALRPLRSSLKFEAQFGQIIGLVPRERWPSADYSVEEWQTLFAPGQQALDCQTIFTNILTNNGGDIDYVLGASEGAKIFDKAAFTREVVYEFQCKTRTAESFVIRINEDGSHHLWHPTNTVGCINVHMAASIWDACVLLTETSSFQPTDTELLAVESLVKSIHIKPAEKLVITYRVPDDKEIEVLSVHCRRMTYHRCTTQDRDDMIAKITEAQDLEMMVNTFDRSIRQAVGSFGMLRKAGKIHYHMSLESSTINGKLCLNENSEMGVDNDKWDESILSHRLMVNFMTTLQMLVKSIDGVGAANRPPPEQSSVSQAGTTRRSNHAGSIVNGDNASLYPDDSATAIVSRKGTFTEGKPFW